MDNTTTDSVLCACACARTALRHVPAGDLRPLRAIETAERWARGEATQDDLAEARRAAYAAYVEHSAEATYDRHTAAEAACAAAFEAANAAACAPHAASTAAEDAQACAAYAAFAST